MLTFLQPRHFDSVISFPAIAENLPSGVWQFQQIFKSSGLPGRGSPFARNAEFGESGFESSCEPALKADFVKASTAPA